MHKWLQGLWTAIKLHLKKIIKMIMNEPQCQLFQGIARFKFCQKLMFRKNISKKFDPEIFKPKIVKYMTFGDQKINIWELRWFVNMYEFLRLMKYRRQMKWDKDAKFQWRSIRIQHSEKHFENFGVKIFMPKTKTWLLGPEI